MANKKAGACFAGTGFVKSGGMKRWFRPATLTAAIEVIDVIDVIDLVAYCAAGKPWIFIPGLMPFDVNQPLLISNAYMPLFFGQ